MLSWEYPPLVVGGIAAHVDGLARAMQRAGHEVVVCSLHHPDEPDDTVVEGVRVLRADPDLPWLPDDDLVARMASANHQLVQLVAQLGDWRPDVVHAHDWLVAWAGDTLKTLLGVPLVATIHATERGRHGGHLPPGLPGTINSVEWWLDLPGPRGHRLLAVHGARGGAAASSCPPRRCTWCPTASTPSAGGRRSPTAPASEREPLVVAWGRIQYEKGFQVLARAIGELRHRVPGIRCVIAGRGSYLPELQTQIDMEGVSDIVQLAGFVPDDELHGLLHRAGCVVIPSLYEPFGIVALEGMAAGAPTIVARTGGLAEIVDGTDAGMLFEPGNHHELADRIAEVIADPAAADRLRANAAALLRRTVHLGRHRRRDRRGVPHRARLTGDRSVLRVDS